MSFAALRWVYEQEHTTKRNDRLVLLALAFHANDDGWCWPSVETIAAETNASRSVVFECLVRLERGGLIERRQQRGDVTMYRVPAGDEEGSGSAEGGPGSRTGDAESGQGGCPGFRTGGVRTSGHRTESELKAAAVGRGTSSTTNPAEEDELSLSDDDALDDRERRALDWLLGLPKIEQRNVQRRLEAQQGGKPIARLSSWARAVAKAGDLADRVEAVDRPGQAAPRRNPNIPEGW